MSTMRTSQEIDAEIAALTALKPRVPARSFFGDDNHAAIDAQIALLTERMSNYAVHSRFGDDDSTQDYSEHELHCALDACDWMHGTRAADEESPAKGWEGLAK